MVYGIKRSIFKCERNIHFWIRTYDNRPDDLSHQQYANMVGCSRSKIARLGSQIAEYRSKAAAGLGRYMRTPCPRNSTLETVSHDLMTRMRELHCNCRYKSFKYQLEAILPEYPEIGDVKLSQTWFTAFLKRHNLSLRKQCGKAAGSDKPAAKKYVKEFVKMVKDLGIKPEHLFNADETAFRHIPDFSDGVGEIGARNNSGAVESKENSTVLFTHSACGTYQGVPLVVRQNLHRDVRDNIIRPGHDEEEEEEEDDYEERKETPIRRTTKKRRISSPISSSSSSTKEEEEEEEEGDYPIHNVGEGGELQYHFATTPKGWMSMKLFETWFNTIFVPSAKDHLEANGEQQYGILLIDNAPVHPMSIVSEDQSFFCIFMPPNTTALIQPEDQHIIRSIKAKYDSKMFNILNTEALTYGDPMEEVVQQLQFTDFVNVMVESWGELTQRELHHSWDNLLFKEVEGIFIEHHIIHCFIDGYFEDEGLELERKSFFLEVQESEHADFFAKWFWKQRNPSKKPVKIKGLGRRRHTVTNKESCKRSRPSAQDIEDDLAREHNSSMGEHLKSSFLGSDRRATSRGNRRSSRMRKMTNNN